MRLLFVAMALGSGAAFADKQCSPFDQMADGGTPNDNAACCEGAFNDDGCGPCKCEDGCTEPKERNVGDPVDALSGFAWFDQTDVSLPQPWGPAVSFVRTYSTHWAQSHGGTDDIGTLGPAGTTTGLTTWSCRARRLRRSSCCVAETPEPKSTNTTARGT